MRHFVYIAGLIAVCASPALAQDRNMGDWYLSGSAGWSFMSETDFSGAEQSGEFEDSPNFSIAVGREYGDSIRGEFEFSYRDADVDDSATYRGELESYGFMANGYYDFQIDEAFSPYLMAGLGTVLQDADIDVNATGTRLVDDEEWTFAWQAGAGINMSFAENTEFYAGYRYQGATEAEADLVDIDLEAHEALIGIRYYFR